MFFMGNIRNLKLLSCTRACAAAAALALFISTPASASILLNTPEDRLYFALAFRDFCGREFPDLKPALKPSFEQFSELNKTRLAKLRKDESFRKNLAAFRFAIDNSMFKRADCEDAITKFPEWRVDAPQ